MMLMNNDNVENEYLENGIYRYNKNIATSSLVFKKNVIKSSIIFKKSNLKYIELHLAEHCNLNCVGCGHYSNIAKEEYADIEQYKKDIFRLSELFFNIEVIRLMGGEPLLNKNAALFIKVTRDAFPMAKIRFVTNGILLTQANNTFWDTCKNTNTVIDFTIYKTMEFKIEVIKETCKEKQVDLFVSDLVTIFFAGSNSDGSSLKEESFSFCRSISPCNFLKQGFIYPCAKAAGIKHFNNKFNTNRPSNEGINIHSKISASDIQTYLKTPIDLCKWCTIEYESFKWNTKADAELKDWDISTYKVLK